MTVKRRAGHWFHSVARARAAATAAAAAALAALAAAVYHIVSTMFRFWLVSTAVVVLLIASCTPQTFQYSRSWKNGKRNADAAELTDENGSSGGGSDGDRVWTGGVHVSTQANIKQLVQLQRYLVDTFLKKSRFSNQSIRPKC